jgi:CubicO group peptidase (beta-lactamase class C family)
VAARALRAATGASVRDYLMPRVFGPLAIHNPQWHTCPLGHPVAESDLFLRTSELARFGRLLLDDGPHESRQLVPAGYCARIAAESVATVNDPEDQGFRLAPRYGLGAWCGPGDGTFSMARPYGSSASSPRPVRRWSRSPPTWSQALRAPRSRSWSPRSYSTASRTSATSGSRGRCWRRWSGRAGREVGVSGVVMDVLRASPHS